MQPDLFAKLIYKLHYDSPFFVLRVFFSVSCNRKMFSLYYTTNPKKFQVGRADSRSAVPTAIMLKLRSRSLFYFAENTLLFAAFAP
ncbi:MAG TPA: hypothetical protein DCP68_09195 [Ruminococcus sp.]|nr:hypothetical protein [Ruminococcus sp.]